MNWQEYKTKRPPVTEDLRTELGIGFKKDRQLVRVLGRTGIFRLMGLSGDGTFLLWGPISSMPKRSHAMFTNAQPQDCTEAK